MDKQFIVAIGREFGSGGHEIGKQLAAKLGVNFYDRNLLDHMWDGLDIDADEFEKYDEKSKTPFLTRRVRGHSSSLEENLAQMQFDFIKEKADSGESFLIVGRCAEAVLRRRSELISIFVIADEHAKLKRIEEKYDLFIQSSRDEGFGLTIAEAMAAKVPVLVSNIPGPMEVIDNGRLGMSFENENPADCAEKIKQFILNGRNETQVEDAYQYVKSHYDVSVTAQKYLEVYESILKE